MIPWCRLGPHWSAGLIITSLFIEFIERYLLKCSSSGVGWGHIGGSNFNIDLLLDYSQKLKVEIYIWHNMYTYARVLTFW